MASTHDGTITLNNGEAAVLPPYRRVKIDTGTPAECVYADASDGDGWIGVTLPMEGGDTAVGAPQTIRLRGPHLGLKIETSEAVDIGDSLYPENDGKVSDTAGTVVIGICLSATTASGGITEMLAQPPKAAVSSFENVITDPGDAGAIPVTVSGYCPIVTTGAETRTLADPTIAGQILVLSMKTDGGDCVITVASPIDQAGRLTITFNDAGDTLVLNGVEDGADIEWRVLADDNYNNLASPITDPGDAGAIPVTHGGYCPLVTGGAETRTLAAPTFIGQELLLYLKTDGGNCVVTCATTFNETGNNTATYDNTGEYQRLIAVEEGANLRWREVANDGAALTTV